MNTMARWTRRRCPMKPATELIHVADGIRDDAAPLDDARSTRRRRSCSRTRSRCAITTKGDRRSFSTRATPTRPSWRSRRRSPDSKAPRARSSSRADRRRRRPRSSRSSPPATRSCAARAIYGGTLHLISDLLPKFGIRPRFVSIDELRQPESMLSPATKMVWFESPINPTLRCVDIAAVAAACRARGVTSVVDNTFASPINQRPLALGVDVVMHSATKYLNGHSDVTAGVLAGSAGMMEKVLKARKLVGAVLDPYAGLRAWPRPQDGGGAGRAPERERARRGARARAAAGASSASTIPASSRTPITPSPNAR